MTRKSETSLKVTGQEHGPSPCLRRWFARTLLQCESSLARPLFAAVAVWLSDLRKRCMFFVYVSACLQTSACPLPSRDGAKWSFYLGVTRVPRQCGGRDERRLLTMSVTSVNAGCPCINVYIYSLTSIVPHCNLFPHLRPRSSPTPLVLLMKRRWRERPEERCNKKQTQISEKKKGHPFLLVEGRDVIKRGEKKR